MVHPSVNFFHMSASFVAEDILVGPDAQLYLTRDVGRLEAYDQHGHRRWSRGADEWPMVAPAVLSDGKILHSFGGLFGSGPSRVRVFHPDGKLEWEHPVPNFIVESCPLAPGDGKIYVAAHGDPLARAPGKVVALRAADGAMLWECKIGHSFVREMALSPDHTSVVGAGPGGIFCISTGGQMQWTALPKDTELWHGPAICPDGRILVVGGSEAPRMNKLYCYSPQGEQLWEANLPGYGDRPSVSSGGDAIFCCGGDAHQTLCFDANGTLRWTFQTDGFIGGSATLDAEDTIYFGTETGVIALNHAGQELWRYAPGGRFDEASPSIGVDGTLYVSGDGKIVALHD